MHTAIDSDWYWLREIYKLLAAHGASNPLTDLIAPIASIVLAAAAVFVAFMSWRTANSANRLTADHWREERDENLLRQRRAIAIDMRDWYWAKRLNSIWDRPDDQELTEFQGDIRRECDRTGEADGKRLMSYLIHTTWRERERLWRADPKERSMRAHPSQLGVHDEGDDLIDSWVANPDSIRATLDARDAERQREIEEAMAGVNDPMPTSDNVVD